MIIHYYGFIIWYYLFILEEKKDAAEFPANDDGASLKREEEIESTIHFRSFVDWFQPPLRSKVRPNLRRQRSFKWPSITWRCSTTKVRPTNQPTNSLFKNKRCIPCKMLPNPLPKRTFKKVMEMILFDQDSWIDLLFVALLRTSKHKVNNRLQNPILIFCCYYYGKIRTFKNEVILCQWFTLKRRIFVFILMFNFYRRKSNLIFIVFLNYVKIKIESK